MTKPEKLIEIAIPISERTYRKPLGDYPSVILIPYGY
jgi:hypothetical protein